MKTLTVCIEGIDGCGKGTISERLATDLQAARFKFPDARTDVGRLIYDHLGQKWTTKLTVEGRGSALSVHPSGLSPGEVEAVVCASEQRLNALVFQMLQLSNRVERVPMILAARTGQDVVLDRYWPSAVAYGGADGIDRDLTIRLNRALPQPDVFILLDVDLEHSMARRPERRDRYEVDGDRMTQRIVYYRALWSAMVKPMTWLNYGFQRPVPSWHVVNARGPVDDVYAAVRAIVSAARK